MKNYLSWKILAVLLVTLFLGFYNLPSGAQETILPFAPESITSNKMHLGLDLQGGSQLDYKVDLRKVPVEDQESIVDGVLEVIQRRVNGLGVSEPNIYTSVIADETHIIVEIAETAALTQEDVDTYLGKDKSVDELTDDEKKLVSLEKAKATVGKTIQLEFKEEKDEIDPQEEEEVRANAKAALDRVLSGADYNVVGQEEQQAYPGKVTYETSEYVFETDLPEKLKSTILALEPGEVNDSLVETGGTFIIDEATGDPIEETGLAIVKLDEVSEEVKNEKEVEVSHILISYKDAELADASITKTKDEAYDTAKEVLQKVKDGEDFATLAQEYSNDPGSKEQGGRLDTPVTGDGTYVYDFEEAALAFNETGEISDIIETQFGYHIIKSLDVETAVTEKQYKYSTITFSLVPDTWQETGLTGEHFVHADVQLDNYYQPYVSIQFNDEGAELFEEITTKNVDKRVAIFVGGSLISAPRVNEPIAGGSAQITGQFTTEEAQTLARDLNTGAIPAPIVLTGEYTIGATLGQEALSKSLWAGSIGLLLVMIFMPLFYKLPGLIADASLLVYSAIFLFLLKSEMSLAIALVMSLIIFGYLVVKIVNNKDSGWDKMLSFILACAGFFFLMFLLKTPVVMTLAGVAGIILSIGMAVDANILIFERFKEELKEGKSYTAALQAGFERAWTAIRDSNFSTLLICAILFTFGSSIIKGFAFTLAAGVLVSMFTAITITKLLMQYFSGKEITKNLSALGIREEKGKQIPFMKKARTWLTISGVAVAISLLATVVFGLNLGLDFTGGTLLEFQFTEEVSKDTLTQTLAEIGEEVNTLETTEAAEESGSIMLTNTSTDDTELSTNTSDAIDLSAAQILNSGENGYIVKTKYITSEQHDEIVAKMKESLPEFTEARFTTIGPVIGSTMLASAMKAIGLALLVIILYVAFAFRKIPKEVSPWRFGVVAIAALIHDVVIITGLFVILGQFLNVEIDALFVTAMLTVFGYSVNDTIVIFDRIRDNLIKRDHEENLEKIADKALNQTFVRSINTSLSTLFTLIAVLLLGSSSIFYFILALTAGTVVGTYSSIFIASPLLVKWSNWAMKKKIEN